VICDLAQFPVIPSRPSDATHGAERRSDDATKRRSDEATTRRRDDATTRRSGTPKSLFMNRPPDDTRFRKWMNRFRRIQAGVPDWLTLDPATLEADYLRQRRLPHRFEGYEVLVDREKRPSPSLPRGIGSELAVIRDFYCLCRDRSSRVLTIGQERYWLLSYQCPSQWRYFRRRADLIGLREDGGLAVFECKLRTNRKDNPGIGILQGLDYLTCLTGKQNFRRIEGEFRRWRGSRSTEIPAGFHGCSPNALSRQAVILLAPAEYYAFHERTRRGPGWLEIGFAVSGFNGPTAWWWTANTSKAAFGRNQMRGRPPPSC
jgi:hypothetical protein